MTDGHRIFRNFSALMLAQLVSNIAGLLSTAYLARVLLPEGFGILGWGIALLGYLGLVVNPGVDRHAVREIARDPDLLQGMTGNVIGFRLVVALLLYLVLAAVILFFGPDGLKGTVLLVQATGLFVTAITIDFSFQAMQRMGAIAWRQIATSLLILAGVFVFVADAGDVPVAAAVSMLASAIAAIGMLCTFARTQPGFRPRLEFPVIREMVKKSLPVALAAFLTAIFISADIVMLGLLAGDHEVGLYTAAARIFILAVMPATMIGTAFLPHLAATKDDADARQSAMTLHAKALLLFGIMVVAGGIACVSPLIALLFGPAFSGAEIIVTLLFCATGLAYFRLCLDAPLMAWGQDNWRIRALGIGAAANILLNLYLIPLYAGEGAAIATIISELVVLAILMVNRGWFRLLPVLWLQARAVALTLLAAWLVMTLTPADAGNISALLWASVLVIGVAFTGALALRIASFSTLARILRSSAAPPQA
ncbi:MAG: oligosaccharide flippase family protein [Rhodospirillales bacterium]